MEIIPFYKLSPLPFIIRWRHVEESLFCNALENCNELPPEIKNFENLEKCRKKL